MPSQMMTQKVNNTKYCTVALWQAAREAYAYQCWPPMTVKINSY